MVNIPRPTIDIDSWRASLVASASKTPLGSLVSTKSTAAAGADALADSSSPNAEESRDEDTTNSSQKEMPSTRGALKLGSFANENHSSPPLFHEANDMLNLSNLIYTLTAVRGLVRDGKLKNAQSMRVVDALPLPLDAVLQVISTEGEEIAKLLDDGEHEATLSALTSLLDRQREMKAMQKGGKNDSGNGWDVFGFIANTCGIYTDKQAENERSVITAIGDSKDNKGLVYAVGVNPLEERITVVFRGSVTKYDFMADANINMTHVRINEEDSKCGIHQGFYDYLFGSSDGKPSKYEEIMQHIRELADDPARKGYKLYITGHSLGGALATLFGFYVASTSSPSLPLPVTVVSVASPRLGNSDYARAFVEMESRGKLRHLRIVNNMDPVTLGPTISSRRAIALSAKVFSPLGYLALHLTGKNEGGDEEVYYHCGMRMKLFKDASNGKRCQISYSGASIISGSKANESNEDDNVEKSNSMWSKTSASELPLVQYHFGSIYAERMVSVEPELKGLTLDKLYKEKAGGLL